ncbi:hypothetical protein HDU99_001807, partial [Rhizoclosmatium hyalinum]
MNLPLLLVALTTSYSVQAGSCFSGPILPPTAQGSSSSGRNATSQSNTHVQLGIKFPDSRTETETKDTPKQPNIIFLLTDDQDKHLGSLEYMPFVKKHLIEKGTVFENHFVTSAICCPSRVSVLKGQFAHNTGFTDVFGPFGGYDKFLREGMDNEYLATWLQSAGYSTYYIGKLLNGYGVHNKEQIPKGWTEFDALVHPYIYDNFHPVFAKNGVISDYEGTFQVDVVREKALEVLSGAFKTVDEKPFFLYLAPTAPHTEVLFNSQSKVEQIPGEKPYTPQIKFTEAVPASRHAELFPNVKIPRRDNFNTADVSGKPRYISELPLLNDEQVETLDHWHRQRLRALQSVDELLDSVVNAVEAAGQGDNT